MRFLVTAFSAITLLTTYAHAEDAAKCPWEFVTGKWKQSDDSGYSADIEWNSAGDGDAVVGTWTDKDGAKYTELVGWRPEKKMLVATGYGTNGSYWELKATKVTASMIKGKIVDRRPDGMTYTGTWQCKKVSDDLIETNFTGSDGSDQKITIKGAFKRVK